MQKSIHQLRQVIPYLIVALAALAAVVGLWLVQAVSLYSCGVSDVDCATFSDFEAHDSFCIIDPACVSPLYNPSTPGIQRWVGAQAWNLGADQQPPDDYDFLAIPNYILFM